jgi:hypothetical protein
MHIGGLVLDQWKVAYIITPKAMCTSMLWMMAGLQNEDLAHDVIGSRTAEVTRALAVHDQALWRHRLLSELPTRIVDRVVNEEGWFRFALTRHPVDRLWSAWQSKLLLREPESAPDWVAEPWFPRIPNNLLEGAAGLDAIVEDFAHFVDALAADQQLLIANQHWAPQSYLLQPEDFPYSEIGRVESVAGTLGRLEEHLRGQGWRGAFELKRFNVTLLPRTVIRDVTLLRQIEEIYAEDMTAFGYRPATVGDQPSAYATAVAVHAIAELVARHERIGDIHRLLK